MAILRIVIVGGIIVLAVWLLYEVVLLIFLAVLIAVLLRHTSVWLARRTHMPVGAALAIVAILVIAMVLGFIVWVAPNLLQQARALIGNISSRIGTLRADYGGTPIGHMLFDHLASFGKSAGGGAGGMLAGSAATAVRSTFGALLGLFLVIVTALYFAVSPTLYVNGVVRLFPVPRRQRARAIMHRMGHDLTWWALGQLVDMIAVGVLSGIGLSLIGVPLALALAVLAGVLTFIPYLGAIIAAIPALIVGLSVSLTDALWVVVVFAICHGIEGYVIAPLVQRRTVHLPPALTILSMTVMGAVFGILGVILGTPLAVIALVATQEIYVADTLGDHTLSVAGPSD